jgi:putative ABC transport system substrate-binding protein
MRRRAFLRAFGLILAAAPLAAGAQQQNRVHRIGYLGFAPAATSATRVEAFVDGMRDLGYVEGKNLVIEFRWGSSSDELRELAAELARSQVELIFGTSSTETEAARQATSTIPIVFATHADPVGTGHVASLARPGGNITGSSVLQTDLTAKAMEILKEAVPSANRFGVLSSEAAPSHRPTVDAARAAGEKLGATVHVVGVRNTDQFEKAFADFQRAGVQALFVSASSVTVRGNPALLAELALKSKLPTMFGARDNVVAGGFMSYAPDQIDLSRRAAVYVDKILKGAKPADLPVEQPQFELVVNLRTARALGITVPPSFVLQADRAIR